jgi:hypothetical protein
VYSRIKNNQSTTKIQIMPSFAVNSKSDDGPHKKQRKEQTSVLNFFATSCSSASAAGDDKNIAIDLTDQDDSAAEQPIDLNRKVGTGTDAQKKQKFAIFCDLDGVLVDFNAGVKRLNRGKGVDTLSRKQMWGSIARAGNFFLDLPWTHDGKDLWSKMVEHGYYPSILTGIPCVKGSREQKFSWCERELKYAFDSLGKSVIFNHVDYASPRNEHERKSGSIRKGKNIDGFLKNNLLEPLSLYYRHEELVQEMEARGYKHKSPLTEIDASIVLYLEPNKMNWKINRGQSLSDLLSRCPDCWKRFNI